MSDDFDIHKIRSTNTKPDFKEIKNALINSLQIKYYLKNIHSHNLKLTLKKNDKLDSRVFYDLGFMINHVENVLKVDFQNRCVLVPRNWKEIIDYSCSIKKIKSSINRKKKKNES